MHLGVFPRTSTASRIKYILILVTCCSFQDIDLYTVKVEDLAFKSDFEIIMKRDDYVHGFVAWFDTWFNACHKPVFFSTGPHAKYTHWKQSLFLFIHPFVRIF